MSKSNYGPLDNYGPEDNDPGTAFITHNVDDTITIKIRSPGDRVFSEVEMSLDAWLKLRSLGGPGNFAGRSMTMECVRNHRIECPGHVSIECCLNDEIGLSQGIRPIENDNCGRTSSAIEPRFFIDHGMIHDRTTGKHVTTEPDSAFCDGIERCCELLNALSEQREPRAFPLLFTSEWLEEKIKADPDLDCEVGGPSASRKNGDPCPSCHLPYSDGDTCPAIRGGCPMGGDF